VGRGRNVSILTQILKGGFSVSYIQFFGRRTISSYRACENLLGERVTPNWPTLFLGPWGGGGGGKKKKTPPRAPLKTRFKDWEVQRVLGGKNSIRTISPNRAGK